MKKIKTLIVSSLCLFLSACTIYDTSSVSETNKDEDTTINDETTELSKDITEITTEEETTSTNEESTDGETSTIDETSSSESSSSGETSVHYDPYNIDPSLAVNKIDNISDDFIFGMDTSSLIALENSGVKFYNYENKETDLLEILAEQGITHIRVRVWNDPFDENGNGYGGGNCTIQTALEIGKRATRYGMKLFVDFHYSDFWADPVKQQAPKAWEDYSVTEKADAIYTYTKESLNILKAEEVDVGLVQLGNETNNGKCCGVSSFEDMCTLFKEGSKAVREVYPSSLVAVHFTNPEKPNRLVSYASYLNQYGLDYDVFGSSYYPYWHGTLDNLSTVLSDVATRYNKKVMVMETSYLNTLSDTDYFGNTISSDKVTSEYPFSDYPVSEQGQMNFIHDLCDTLVNKTTNCIGLSYWEGAWISVNQNSYAKNFQLWEKYGSGWASSYCKGYDPDDGGKYYGGSAVDNEAFFTRYGSTRQSLKVFDMLKNGSEDQPVTKTNLLLNPSFEDINNPVWSIVQNSTMSELGIKATSDAIDGARTCHFWSQDANTVNFDIYQSVSLEKGSYNYSICLMGGDAGTYSAYSYVKINDAIIYQTTGSITGWQNWDTLIIENIQINDATEAIFGIHVECSGAGAWGDVDNSSLFIQ